MEKDCKRKHNQAHEQAKVSEQVGHLCNVRENGQESTNKWSIDRGCSNHMTKDSSDFTQLDTSIKIPIRLGNGVVVSSSGKGTIAIETRKQNISRQSCMYQIWVRID